MPNRDDHHQEDSAEDWSVHSPQLQLPLAVAITPVRAANEPVQSRQLPGLRAVWFGDRLVSCAEGSILSGIGLARRG